MTRRLVLTALLACTALTTSACTTHIVPPKPKVVVAPKPKVVVVHPKPAHPKKHCHWHGGRRHCHR